MCTATYYPLSSKAYLLTHNRDEVGERGKVSTFPKPYTIAKGELYAPKDLQSDGTWIGTTNCMFSVCLLNGGFEKHLSKSSYNKSRGKIIFQFFETYSVQKFLNQTNFNDYEPFTFIVVDTQNEEIKLDEIIWDGESVHHNILDAAKRHIWSSSTLYSKEVREIKAELFSSLNIKKFNYQEELLAFHKSKIKEGQKAALILEPDDLERQTVAITYIEKGINNSCKLYYEDLLLNKNETIRIFD
jgi:hypothetical protein